MPATICAMCWSGMSGSAVLAEVRERRVGAVPEQEELAVVLPHEVAAAQQPSVRLEHLDIRRVAIVLEDDLVGLVLEELRDVEAR